MTEGCFEITIVRRGKDDGDVKLHENVSGKRSLNDEHSSLVAKGENCSGRLLKT